MRARTAIVLAPTLLAFVLALFLPSGCSRHGAADEKNAGGPADSGKASAVVSPVPPSAESAAPAVPGNVTIDNADGVTAGVMASPWQLGLGRVSEVAAALPTPPEPAASASQSPKNITLDGADGVTAGDMVVPSQEFAGSRSASLLLVLVEGGSGSIGATLESEAPLASSAAGVPLAVSIEHAAGVLGRNLVRQDDLDSRQGQ
ncbi:MAG: hypothetical protein NTX23_09805 [Candidatus Bipolaricaulota bacterium]|nr:hypothetical protein [Candidatus Bipolaricaulota bacterium]